MTPDIYYEYTEVKKKSLRGTENKPLDRNKMDILLPQTQRSAKKKSAAQAAQVFLLLQADSVPIVTRTFVSACTTCHNQHSESAEGRLRPEDKTSPA